MSEGPLTGIADAEAGERLRIARETANLTQKEAADAIGVARTTVIAIEQGQRRVRVDEIQRLAKLYKKSVNEILRREAIHVDLVPRFRKLIGANNNASIGASELLSNLARAEVELENLLGIKRTRNYPPERPILGGDVAAQAEHDALELRHRLGLGYAPVLDMVTFLELELGVRVYVRRIDPGISGVFAYDEAVGACILLNANHPKERRNQTSGHELGHFIGTRNAPEVLHLNEPEGSREERYANTFGRAFLTPAPAVRQKFQEITAGASHLTRRHIIVLAHYFGVSREAVGRRVEELELAKKGTWDWFEANGGITDVQAQQVLGDLIAPDKHKPEADRPTTLRLSLLAAGAYRRGLLSEGQLARLLLIDRVELRRLVHDFDTQEDEANGAPNALA